MTVTYPAVFARGDARAGGGPRGSEGAGAVRVFQVPSEPGRTAGLSAECLTYIIFFNVIHEYRCNHFDLVTCMISLGNLFKYCPNVVDSLNTVLLWYHWLYFTITKLYWNDFNVHTSDSSDDLLTQFLDLINSRDLCFSPSIPDQVHTSLMAEPRLQSLGDSFHLSIFHSF